MQDIEFTVQQNKLYMLQTRNGKRTAAASLKIAVDMAREGLPFREAYRLAADPARWAEGDPDASLRARVSPGASGELRLDALKERLARLPE